MVRRLGTSGGLAALLALGVAGCDRPVTLAASSFEPTAIHLRNMTGEAGIGFRLGHGGRTPLTILETLGHGCAFFDANGDGNLDLLLLGDNKIAFYHGDGRGRFTDATERARLRLRGYWHGAATGDYDNDGDPDLCLTGYRALAVLRNDDGAFTDVTGASGVSRPDWGSSCAFTDLDADGRLDLIIGEYLEFGPESVQFCTVNEVRSACGPKIYRARYPRVYRNAGGRFEDVTRAWGFSSAQGKALGLTVGDYNTDGRLDVAIANDEMPLDLFIRADGPAPRFRNESLNRGLAYLSTGAVQSAMGIDTADLDGDDREDVVVTNFQNEPAALYHNRGGWFQEISARAGVSEPTFPYVGWGVRFFDPDNDGDLDLLMANGHIQDNAHLTEAYTTYAQPLLLLERSGERFERARGALYDRPIVGRGLATGDYDNDGRTDALVVDLEGAPLLLHNETANGNHWLGLEVLTGQPPRPALGSLVSVETHSRSASRRVGTAGSIFSAHDPRIVFGLANDSQITRIVVQWVDGRRELFTPPAVDRYHRIVRGSGSALPAESP